MTIRKRMVLPLALAVGALGMMALASVANATHPRPKGATPLRASLVPAYNACATPNRTHGTPLAFPSCNPPVQTSTSLTDRLARRERRRGELGRFHQDRRDRRCAGSA